MPFIVDILSILQNQIIGKFEEKYSRDQALDIYVQLISSYNIPNTFWPVLAGIVNDIYGYRVSMMIFLVNSLLGQIFVSICFYNFENPSYLVLGYMGRFLLGMSDSIEIPTFTLINQWFNADETMMAVSNVFLLQTIIQMLANYYVPKMAYSYSINFVMTVALGFVTVSFLSGCLLFVLDKYVYKKEVEIQENNKVLAEEIVNLPTIYWSSLFAANLPYSIYFSFLVFQGQLLDIQLLKYDPNFTHEQLIEQEAVLSSIPYLIQIPLYPILGYVLDKYGQRIKLLWICVYTFLISILIFDKFHPLYSVILNGIFVALTITVSTSIYQQVVKKSQCGLGLGIINCIISMMVVVFNYLGNIVFKNDNSQFCQHKCIIYYFVFLTIVNLICCYYNSYVDKQREVSLDSNNVDMLQELIYREVDINVYFSNNPHASLDIDELKVFKNSKRNISFDKDDSFKLNKKIL